MNLGLLNTEDRRQPHALHYIFLPRINKVISSFVTEWKRHPIRTEKNWSPERIWTNGMIDVRNMHQCQIAELNENSGATDLAWFGFDSSAPCPPDSGLSKVDLDDVICPLDSETLEREIARN